MLIHVGVLRIDRARSESAISDVERQWLFGLDWLIVAITVEPLHKEMHDRHFLFVWQQTKHHNRLTSLVQLCRHIAQNSPSQHISNHDMLPKFH